MIQLPCPDVEIRYGLTNRDPRDQSDRPLPPAIHAVAIKSLWRCYYDRFIFRVYSRPCVLPSQAPELLYWLNFRTLHIHSIGTRHYSLGNGARSDRGAGKIMRNQSIRYFIGSLLSRQALYAYAMAGGLTTGVQMLMISGEIPRTALRTERLPVVVELYIDTLIPLWIPPITSLDIVVVLINVIITVWILLYWTIRYEQSI